ncbi:hypothetical protein QNI19_25660 [Cytophagaceae bacterium DM2B3-1]|uniref:Outer membrane protein beta-barrel domain-containing protein n=1 Tax=Xanthocytophaga flava TaxID=3048013 RepID=A0ABT7CRH6_9BACT|nr:hypothetical protein [Xanthocytophaga flavus]MDJ1470510.1 hypothetical protein [Xanthocytophaga flavus]MDJ1496350.1 hypothetical protein [Xanthocytophaga flavus]
MRKIYLVLAFLAVSTALLAQQKKSTASAKKAPASSAKSTAKKSSASASYSSHPSWGVGLRLGTLTGLTVKKYFTKSALEFNLGTMYNYGYNYDNRFNKNNYKYIGYGSYRALGLQAHYMGQKAIKGASGLDWYYGGGVQFRFDRTTYTYDFKSYYGPGKNDYVWVRTTDRPVFVDFGLDGIIGLEYKFKKAPLSVFADANLYIELSHDPGWVNMQGGLGIRYNF